MFTPSMRMFRKEHSIVVAIQISGTTIPIGFSDPLQILETFEFSVEKQSYFDRLNWKVLTTT